MIKCVIALFRDRNSDLKVIRYFFFEDADSESCPGVEQRRAACRRRRCAHAAAMIAADIAELDSRLKQLTLQIRDKELSLFTVNFGVLGTKAAFLCGLGWSGLTMVPNYHGCVSSTDCATRPPEFAYLAFYTLDSLSVCFNLLTICLSTWCMVNGPMLAIRGPSGSMGRAVAGMYAERKWALRFFWTGNLFILLSCVALGWLKFERSIAIVNTAILVPFIFALYFYIRKITRPRFRIPENTPGKRPQARNPNEERLGFHEHLPGALIGAPSGLGDIEAAASSNPAVAKKRASVFSAFAA